METAFPRCKGKGVQKVVANTPVGPHPFPSQAGFSPTAGELSLASGRSARLLFDAEFPRRQGTRWGTDRRSPAKTSHLQQRPGPAEFILKKRKEKKKKQQNNQNPNTANIHPLATSYLSNALAIILCN